MDYRKLFKSDWFTAADIPDSGELEVTIRAVSIETVKNAGGEEQRPAIHFDGHKPLVLNKTNAKLIAAKHGTDADAWNNKTVTLRESVTTFNGEEVPCVRVK